MKSFFTKALLIALVLVAGLAVLTDARAAGKSETAEILTAARTYVDGQGASVGKYDVEIFKRSGKWAIVSVLPRGDVEGAGVILEKVGDKWVARDMGTDLSAWEAKAPGLFE